MVGVLVRLLQEQVFDELLFGADRGTKRMLETQDECYIELDGMFLSLFQSLYPSLLLLLTNLAETRLLPHRDAFPKCPRCSRRLYFDPRLLA